MITIGSLSAPLDPPTPPDPGPQGGEQEQAAAEQAAEHPVAEQLKRRLVLAIPITLSVGLLVAAGYVGHRIITGNPQAAPVQAAGPMRNIEPTRNTQPAQPVTAAPPAARENVRTPAPKAVPVAQEAVARARKPSPPEAAAAPENDLRENPAEPVAADSDAALIDPQPGQRYLQIAAISVRAVSWFLSDLESKHLQVRLAPGPSEELRRVLIGPFPDWDSLNRTKAQIQKAWPDCFVRAY
jgi:cell division septation protein DedD